MVSVLQGIQDCATLAPLHNPAHIIGIKAAQKAFPALKNVAVFDTAFHQTMPEEAFLYALPYKLYKEQSVCAIKNGESVDTSMGMTPLEGLVMGTRCGDIDPAIIFHLHDALGYSVEQINNMLTKESGLLGLTEVTSDCRFVEDNYGDKEEATRAMDVFCHRLAKYVAGYRKHVSVAKVLSLLLTAVYQRWLSQPTKSWWLLKTPQL